MTETNSVACYVLGVKGKFRGDRLIQDLTSRGFQPQVFFGIDGNSPEGKFLKEKVDQSASELLQGRELSIGEVACSLGHLGIQEAFLKSGEPWALIFEDDVVLHGDLGGIVARLSEIKGPSVLQLHTSIDEDKTVLLSKKIEVQKPRRGDPGLFIQKKLNFSSGAYAYFMNRHAAEIAVRVGSGRKIINIPDWPYLWRHKVNFWELTSNVAGYEGESLLEKERKLSSQVLLPTHAKRSGFRGRLQIFLSNLFFIQTIKFHNLGYPGRVLYFNNVVMPFKRRIIQVGMKVLSFFR